MNLTGLVDHFIDVGPYDQPSIPDTEDKTPPPPMEEDTEEEESVRENEHREDELGGNPLRT